MPINILEGDLRTDSARFGIIVSRWNELVTRKLLDGAIGALTRFGVTEDRIEVVWTPGSWEIPLAAQTLARSGRVQAIVCLGTIIEGETPHAKLLGEAASSSLSQLSLGTSLPIGWGILTCSNLDQALARSGAKMGNKGAEAAMAALEMVSLLEKLGGGHE